MKLDERIKDINAIQTILHYDVNCIGCKGYFFDEFVDTQDLSQCRYGELVDIITDNHDLCFKAELENKNTIFFRFFIPKADLKPVKKKYRPFTLNEFSELYAIGDVVTYRIKDCEAIEQSMLIGFQSSNDEDIPGDGYVLIGNCRYGLRELFNNYELDYQNEWQPFGIIDEDKG